MNAVIIDDEQHARENIRLIVENSFNEINIVGETVTIKNAINLINKTQPELIFLDVNLTDGTSFEILKKVNHKLFKIIFITAYQEYAIQAIKFSAFDYIIKPVNPVELIAAVKKVMDEHQTQDNFDAKIDAFFSNFNSITPEQKKIVVKTSDKIHIVDIRNIIRCESENSYTTIYLNTNKHIVVSKSLKSYEEMLQPMGFMRVHQSHLINCNYISYYDKQLGGALVMTDNSQIPISIQKKPVLTAYLESL